MIKFRNFLVHEYDRVNPLRIYKILKENIDDIESGMKFIKNFVDKNLKQYKGAQPFLLFMRQRCQALLSHFYHWVKSIQGG